MKKSATKAQFIFTHIKYLLLTAVLFMAAIALGKTVLRELGVDASINTDVAHAIVPFFIAAVAAMFIRQLLVNKKS